MSAAAGGAGGPAAQPALASEPRFESSAVSGSPAASKSMVGSLTDEEIFNLAVSGQVKQHELEKVVGDRFRAVSVRRRLVAHSATKSGRTADGEAAIHGLPHESFDSATFYNAVDGSNCENVIGYLPLPVGVVGPLRVDGKDYMVPMATTEGALVASTNRGARAISIAGGVRTVVTSNGMTRAPLIRMPSLESAAALKEWIDRRESQELLAEAFASTSRFGRLQSVVAAVAGRNIYLRFKCSTGDAMGMNMITKGVNAALAEVVSRFQGARVLSLSGNMCTDKKPSAINWIEGRGKSVTAEVRLSRKIIEETLKTTADRLVELNTGKNLIGSAMAGSIGGFNAHAANIVSAVFLATGQDVAQNVESSTCLTMIEHDTDEMNPGGVIATVSMPSIEVGTVGGGTSLASQSACLELLGFKGSAQVPGANAEGLARVVAASVLAGELSLMAAHTTGDLLRAHMALNRKPSAGGASSATTASSSTASVASTSVHAKRAPSHNITTVQGGAGALRHAESAIPTSGRRFFGASLERVVARPSTPARDAPACFSREPTASPSFLDDDAPFLPVP